MPDPSHSERPKASSRLSVIGRQCIAAICVQRFCERYGIRHPSINTFIEHLWAVATVTPDTFEEWELGFQAIPASTWGDPIPADLLAIIPQAVQADYAELANAAVECSAATWYCSDIPATIRAFETVLGIMARHRLPVPPFDRFFTSSPMNQDGWGIRPTLAQLREWRAQT